MLIANLVALLERFRVPHLFHVRLTLFELAEAKGGRPTIEPVGKVAGQTGGELLRESWKQLLLQPADNEFVGH